MGKLSHLSDEDLIEYYKLYNAGLQKTKRFEAQKIDGMDTKFLYHIVRLLGEVEQILIEHDLDLERNREQLKAIRAGMWTMEQIEDYFEKKEKLLEELYIKSDLPYAPDEVKVKTLLINCLEEHYGTLGKDCVVKVDKAWDYLKEIKKNH